MNAVFVSYARADELRVTALVTALEADGLSVWWDQSVGGGDTWRQTILTQLDAAAVVVVVWTVTSVESDWVIEEASRAKRRQVLLPVCIDDVDPPFGFGEVQTLDLRSWNGRRTDPLVQGRALRRPGQAPG